MVLCFFPSLTSAHRFVELWNQALSNWLCSRSFVGRWKIAPTVQHRRWLEPNDLLASSS